MNKSLSTLLAIVLCCLLPVAAHAQSCVTFDKISPESFEQGIAGSQSYFESFTAWSNGTPYYDEPIFTVTAGALPPGLIISENRFLGSITKAGTYTFTIGVMSAPGCPIFEKQYTVDVVWNLPCDQFKLETPYGESGFHLVGVFEYFGICTTAPWDSIQYTVLSLPPNFTLKQYSPVSCPEVWGPPTDTGTFTISVMASVPSGCKDTVTFVHNWGCIPMDSLYPQPYQLAKLPAVVGKPIDRGFNIGFTPHSLELPVIIKAINGTSLPPGLYFENETSYPYNSHLKGTPTTAGIYHFTLGAQLGNSCIIVQHDYTMSIYDTLPCNALKFTPPYREDIPGGSYGYVGSKESFRTCVTIDGWDSLQFSLAEAPPGFAIYADGSRCIHIAGYSKLTGYQNIAIAVTAAGGCQDTVRFPRIYTCSPADSIRPASPQLPVAMKQTFYNQQLAVGPFYTKLYGAHFTVTGGTLPPGLALYDSTDATAHLRGTPTATGNYTFTIAASFGDCPPSSKTFTLQVLPHQIIKSLSLSPECIQDIETRSWRVYNPNNFNVPFTWETVYFEHDSRSLIAPPGNTFFKTKNAANPNSVRITWRDENYIARSVVRGASSTYCSPPTCIVAASVVSYHQGLGKDGNPVIRPENSDANAALGEPDANDYIDDNPARSFILGYNGFIVLELSSRLYDQAGLDLKIVETSYSNPHYSSNPERAEVFVSKNGTQWISLGYTGSPQNCNEFLDHSFDLAGKTDWCRYVKIVDKTDRNAKILTPLTCQPTGIAAFNYYSDGFDLDAVTCAQGATFARQEAVETTSQSTYILYPNPAKDWLTIDLSREKFARDKSIEVYIRDVSGTALYQKTHTLNASTTQCDVSLFRSGMYIVHVRGVSGAGYYKFVKE
ncbi:MAG TPA: putative Ig domain-containing protein [Ohtaekwangia sp.]|uniref:putative Ig domain-containing protein n=1 Tax=Ohtaekwangia sp. TaxID=2066019 RepID=UPI002F953FE4